jgi:hypothetical protein
MESKTYEVGIGDILNNALGETTSIKLMSLEGKRPPSGANTRSRNAMAFKLRTLQPRMAH